MHRRCHGIVHLMILSALPVLVMRPIAATDEVLEKSADVITIPAGTLVEFQLEAKVKARKVRAGEKVPANVSSPVVVAGVEVIAAGTPVTVVVADARRKKAGFFRTAEGFVAMDAVAVKAVDGTQVSLENVTQIEGGSSEKKFTWTAHNANIKAGEAYLAKVTKDTAIRRP